MAIAFKKLHPNAVLPTRATPGDAGLDITATEIKAHNEMYIEYGTGLAVELPPNHVGLLVPRSSVSNKHLSLANSIGILDEGYRGEITFRFRERFGANLENSYKPGDRIGQLVIVPVNLENAVWKDELSRTVRNLKGYGSSGA